MADTFKAYMKEDIDNVFLNPNEFTDWIYWEDGKILANVSDEETDTQGYEGVRVQRKIVSIKMDSIRVLPAVGDQVRLNLDIEKVDFGDIWTVEKVGDDDGMLDVNFIRYVS